MGHKRWESVDAIDGVGTFAGSPTKKGRNKAALKWGA